MMEPEVDDIEKKKEWCVNSQSKSLSKNEIHHIGAAPLQILTSEWPRSASRPSHTLRCHRSCARSPDDSSSRCSFEGRFLMRSQRVRTDSVCTRPAPLSLESNHQHHDQAPRTWPRPRWRFFFFFIRGRKKRGKKRYEVKKKTQPQSKRIHTRPGAVQWCVHTVRRQNGWESDQ